MPPLSEAKITMVNSYLSEVAKRIDSPSPTLIFYFDFLNKYTTGRGRGEIRGRYFYPDYETKEFRNKIGIAMNYNFRDEDDVIKCVKHEIAEWLEFVQDGKELNRRLHIHTNDHTYMNLRRLVSKYFPLRPDKLAESFNDIRKNKHAKV